MNQEKQCATSYVVTYSYGELCWLTTAFCCVWLRRLRRTRIWQTCLPEYRIIQIGWSNRLRRHFTILPPFVFSFLQKDRFDRKLAEVLAFEAQPWRGLDWWGWWTKPTWKLVGWIFSSWKLWQLGENIFDIPGPIKQRKRNNKKVLSLDRCSIW